MSYFFFFFILSFSPILSHSFPISLILVHSLPLVHYLSLSLLSLHTPFSRTVLCVLPLPYQNYTLRPISPPPSSPPIVVHRQVDAINFLSLFCSSACPHCQFHHFAFSSTRLSTRLYVFDYRFVLQFPITSRAHFQNPRRTSFRHSIISTVFLRSRLSCLASKLQMRLYESFHHASHPIPLVRHIFVIVVFFIMVSAHPLTIPFSSHSNVSAVFPRRNRTSIDAFQIPYNPVHVYAEPIDVFLRQGEFTDYFVSSVFLETKSKVPSVTVVYTVVTGENIITILPGDAVEQGEDGNGFLVTNRFQALFNQLPGFAEVKAEFRSNSKLIGAYTSTFNVIGVVIYNMVDAQVHKFTGKNANTDSLTKFSGSTSITSFSVSLFEGSTSSGIVLDKSSLEFQISPSASLRWNNSNCSVTIKQSDLSQDCAFGFSLNYSTFWIFRNRETANHKNPEQIHILWKGLASAEAEASVDFETQPGEEDLITIFYYTNLGPASISLDIVVATSVSVVVGVAIAIAACCCVLRRTRNKVIESNNRTLEGKVRKWIGGYVSSVRTTLGHTDAAMADDALSEGEIMAAYTSRESRPKTAYSQMAFGSDRSGVTAAPPTSHRETDISFSPAEESQVDGLVPLDRYEHDKSVTKLVVPRLQRGVELESSTDGGSDRDVDGDLPSDTDEEGNAIRAGIQDRRDHFIRRRQQRRSKRRVVSRASLGPYSTGALVRRPQDRADETGLGQDGSESEIVEMDQTDQATVTDVRLEDRPSEGLHPETHSAGAQTPSPQSPEEQGLPKEGPRPDTQATGTEGTSSGNGTVVVDETRPDTRMRNGVNAAIDRVRQVDLLYGPATRGLVGRNGEPIASRTPQAGASSSQPAGASDATPKRDDDGAIVTFSTLS